MDATDRGALAGLRLIVVGGGAAGLSVAFEAARRGAAIVVIDAGKAGRGALWAAAGMITPSFEVINADVAHPRLHDLAFRALARWPSFAAAVEGMSSVDVDLRLDGAFASGVPVPDRSAGWEGGALRIDAADARALEPALNEALADIWFAEGEGQVDNRLLSRALVRALHALGVAVIEHAPVADLIERGGRIVGVRTGDDRSWDGDAVVWCVGATPRLATQHTIELQPVGVPVKGQIFALRAETFAPAPPRRVIRGRGVYLAPKRDGRVVVGATMEEGLSDLAVERAAVDGLRRGAAGLAPAARNAEIMDMWAGVRPGSPDEAPFLGPVGPDGLYCASGLHRSGVALAPAVADMLCDRLEGLEDSLAEAFSPTRLGRMRAE